MTPRPQQAPDSCRDSFGRRFCDVTHGIRQPLAAGYRVVPGSLQLLLEGFHNRAAVSMLTPPAEQIMNIIAIGGGSLKERQTLPIDRQIVRLTGMGSPRALFIPTASADDREYCAAFDRVYGDALGCRTEHLLLYRRPGDREDAAAKVRTADLIYVGGGNTLRMMRMWRRFGIDRLLAGACRRGTVLAGVSAGAICWHEWGHSDSRAYSGRKDWSYIKVRSLGLVPGLFCPHLDGEKRQASFRKMVARERMTGIACDNFAAVHYHDAGATCLASRRNAQVHLYIYKEGRVTVRSYRNGERIGLPER